jgi:hypothetical protein
MAELSGAVQEFLNSPAAGPVLQEVFREPERWSKYRGITFDQVAAVAQEAGYDDPEVVALAYESLKYVAGLSGDKVRELIQRLEGVNESGQTQG